MARAPFFLFAVFVALAWLVSHGCASPQDVADSTPVMESSSAWLEVPCSIDMATVKGDELVAVVTYSGGCGDHQFDLESAGPMLKSLPPKQPLKLVHRSSGDPCRAMVHDTLQLDVSSYRGSPRGTTMLMLEGWKELIPYTYH